MVYLIFGFDEHIVIVYLHANPNLICKHSVYQPLVGGSSVLQPERYHIVTIQAFFGYKACVLLVRQMHGDLVVPE